MNFNSNRIERLISLSKLQSYDPYERFKWPDELPADRLFCNEDLLTTYDTEIHDKLTYRQKCELSKWEAVNFFSLNVYGIKAVLEFVSRCIYEERYKDISEYLHIFIAEENAHMWFFAAFCNKYAGIIYPTPALATAETAPPLELDLYMFASTLIFEEFVDFYNHKVGANREVAEIVREINRQHHIDESRHVAFGREIVSHLFEQIMTQDPCDETRQRISGNIKKMFLHFVSLMYNPRAYTDANVASGAGFSSPIAMRNWLRTCEERKRMHSVWFHRTAEYFQRIGVIGDTSFLTSQ
jgi:hypothetical protein